nr:glycine-rich cell wall structural protein 1.8-like [Aegilops tauschii subsp. strangulata]
MGIWGTVRFLPPEKVNGRNGSRRWSGLGRDEAEEDPGSGDGVSGEVFVGGGDGSGRARAPATGSGDGGGGAPPGRRRRTGKTAGGRRMRRARRRAALEIGRRSAGRRGARSGGSVGGGAGAGPGVARFGPERAGSGPRAAAVMWARGGDVAACYWTGRRPDTSVGEGKFVRRRGGEEG